MSTPPIINLGSHYRGDGWDGMTIGPIVEDVNGAPTPPALPCLSCRMHFRDKRDVLGYALSSSPGSGEGTIIINNANTYVFTIPRQVLGLDSGLWKFDFETMDSSGIPITWFQGTMKVDKDKSYG
jgi:hypothetical protein